MQVVEHGHHGGVGPLAATGVEALEDVTYYPSGGTTFPLGTTASGSNDLVTGRLAGASVGDNDIDGGTTSIQSPAITLPTSGNLTPTVSWYLAKQ